MDKNKGILIGGIALIAIIVGAVYTSTNTKKEAILEKEMMDESVVENPITEDEVAMNKENETEIKQSMQDNSMEDSVVAKAGSYEAYSRDKLSRAENGDVVLFFHASWCPSCRGLNKDIENNITSIPNNVTILKTDYDTETELKKKYGVTSQHTLVQVDKDGNLIKKWSGGGTLSGLVAKIQ